MANIAVLKTPQGIFKLIHVVLGALAIGIIGYYVKGTIHLYGGVRNEYFMFMLTSFAFLLTSFLLLVSMILDGSVEFLGKSYFDVLYPLFGLIFYFSVSIAVFLTMSNIPSEFKWSKHYISLVMGTFCGLINSFAYGVNAFVSFNLRN